MWATTTIAYGRICQVNGYQLEISELVKNTDLDCDLRIRRILIIGLLKYKYNNIFPAWILKDKTSDIKASYRS